MSRPALSRGKPPLGALLTRSPRRRAQPRDGRARVLLHDALERPPPLLPATPAQLPSSTPAALALLRQTATASSGIYLRARLHARTYLLHPRDVLTVPTLKPLQAPGTTLALTRILEVGSREYAIKAPAADGREARKSMPKGKVELDTLPPWVASCELTVLEHTKSPLTHTLLKKRRKGYRKTLQNKQGWTRLRVGDIILGDGVPPAESA
ncbi:hypothetical protein Q8F55_007053 [Vanrija albida]|uniref:Large ribosomal subunit protein bL21m n=1 Tax=Vanrija albida TaxID=181172 RepID=A0ABR3PYU5_9TREE